MLHCWIASSIPPQSNNFSANHKSSFANFSGKSASATFLGYNVALLSGLEVHGLTEYNTCVKSDGILTRGARKPILEPMGKFFTSRLQTETNKKNKHSRVSCYEDGAVGARYIQVEQTKNFSLETHPREDKLS